MRAGAVLAVLTRFGVPAELARALATTFQDAGAIANSRFISQAEWYLGGSSSDDTFSGASSAQPVKTLAELERRIGKRNGFIPQSTTINLLGNISEGINFTASVLGPGGPADVLTIKGTRTVVHTDTLTAVTAFSVAGNQYQTVTAPGLGVAHVGLQIRRQSDGARAVVLADLTGGRVVTSVWQLVTRTAPFVADAALPAIGDVVEVFTVPTIGGAIWLESNGTVAFEDCAPTFYAGNMGVVNCFGCDLAIHTLGIPQGGFVEAFGCNLTSNRVVEGKLNIYGGGMRSTSGAGLIAQNGGTIFVRRNFCIYGNGAASSYGMRAIDGGRIINFNSTAGSNGVIGVRNCDYGLIVGVDGFVDLRDYLIGGNGGASSVSQDGIRMDANSRATYNGAGAAGGARVPTLPAAVNPVNVAGTATPYNTPAAALGASYQARLGY